METERTFNLLLRRFLCAGTLPYFWNSSRSASVKLCGIPDSVLVPIPLKRRQPSIRFAEDVDRVARTPPSDPRGSGGAGGRTHANIHFLSTRKHFIRSGERATIHDCAESSEARGGGRAARGRTQSRARNPSTTFAAVSIYFILALSSIV